MTDEIHEVNEEVIHILSQDENDTIEHENHILLTHFLESKIIFTGETTDVIHLHNLSASTGHHPTLIIIALQDIFPNMIHIKGNLYGVKYKNALRNEINKLRLEIHHYIDYKLSPFNYPGIIYLILISVIFIILTILIILHS